MDFLSAPTTCKALSPPQDLCSCYFLCLDCPPPLPSRLTSSCSPSDSQLQGYFPKETFHGSATLPSTHRSILLQHTVVAGIIVNISSVKLASKWSHLLTANNPDEGRTCYFPPSTDREVKNQKTQFSQCHQMVNGRAEIPPSELLTEHVFPTKSQKPGTRSFSPLYHQHPVQCLARDRHLINICKVGHLG